LGTERAVAGTSAGTPSRNAFEYSRLQDLGLRGEAFQTHLHLLAQTNDLFICVVILALQAST
jgi:hypothetical protein